MKNGQWYESIPKLILFRIPSMPYLQDKYTMMRLIVFASLLLILVSACKEDPCEAAVCLNGGTCVDGLGTCECLPGFEGDSCQVSTFQLFLGTFEADYGSCLDTPPEHRVGIAQQGLEDNLTILDLGDYACPSGNIAVSAKVTGNSLTIPEQDIDCGDIVYTFAGTGTANGNVLTIDFTVTYDADGFIRKDECSVILTKE